MNLKTTIKKAMPPHLWGKLFCLRHNLSHAYRIATNNKPDDPYNIFYSHERINDSYYLNAGSHCANFYGIEKVLRSYTHWDKRVAACIEHGVYFGPFVNENETTESGYPAIITFGPSRERHIHSFCDTPVIEIGPYIRYAPTHKSEKRFEQLKSELGRVLTVFPVHSIESTHAEYNQELFLDSVSSLADEYKIDTVLFCVYFHDLNMGNFPEIKKDGYRIVCAGHRYDQLFLERLRLIIEISDVTSSNGVGTHMGYSEALGVPHCFVDTHAAQQDESIVLEMFEGNDGAEVKEAEMKKVEAAFTLPRQKEAIEEVCNEYWGMHKERTAEELFEIFSELNAAYALMRRKQVSQKNALEQIISGANVEQSML